MKKLSTTGWIILINLWLTIVSSSSDANHHQLVDELSSILFTNAEQVLQAFEDNQKLHNGEDDGDDENEDDEDDDEEDSPYNRLKRSIPGQVKMDDLYGFDYGPLPPKLDSPGNVMHGFVPKTDYYHREEVKVVQINQERVSIGYGQSVGRKWSYARHHSVDYFANQGDHRITIWPKVLNSGRYSFQFDSRQALCQLNTHGLVVDSLLYIKAHDSIETLKLAIILRGDNHHQLKLYDVTDKGCDEDVSYPLKGLPLRAAYLKSSQGQQHLVILHEDYKQSKPKVDIMRGQDGGIKYISIFARGAVNLVTFEIIGHPFVAIAYSTGCQIIRFNEFLTDSHSYHEIQAPGIIDLDYFTVDEKHFLSLARKGSSQYLISWADGKFYHRQLFFINSVIRWVNLRFQTCRDDVILGFIRNDTSQPLVLFKWNSKMNKFVPTMPKIAGHQRTANYPPMPGSQAWFTDQKNGYILQNDVYGQARAVIIQTESALVSDPIVDDYFKVGQRMKNLHLIYSNQRGKIHRFQSRQTNAVRAGSMVQVRQNVMNVRASFIRGNIMVTPPQLYFPVLNLGYGESIGFIGQTSNQAAAIRGHLENIKSRLKDVVFLDRDTTLTEKIYLRSRVGLNMLRCYQANIHNGNLFNHIVDSLVKKNEYIQPITGKLYFRSGISARSLDTKKLNGMDLRQQLILRRGSKFIIRSPIRIASLTTTKVIYSNGINQRNMSDFIFLNGPPQSISSPLNFIRNTKINTYLDSQYLSGLNIRSLSRSILTSYGDQIVSSSVTARTAVAPTVVLRTSLNGVPFQKRIQRLVQLNRPIMIRGLTLSSSWIRADNLQTNNLNGYRVPDDFLISSSSAPQKISGAKSFRALNIHRGQTRIRGLVNKLNYPSSFVTLDGNETIESNIEFNSNVVFNRDIYTSGRLGRFKIMNLVSWASDRDSWSMNKKNKPRGKVYVNGNLDIWNHINGINLASLVNDSVHLSEQRAVRVYGTKIFASPLSASTITITHLNDNPFSSFATGNFQAIFSPLRFIKPLTIANLNWNKDQRNRNDILNLIQKRISLLRPGPIYGDLHLQDMIIGRYMFVRGRINTISPSSLVLRSRPQTISAPKTFTRGATFAQPLVSNRAIINYRLNNITMAHLMNSGSRFAKKELSFQKMVLLGATIGKLYPGPSGDWKVNSVPLIHSLKNILLKNGDQTIKERKKFLRPVGLNHGHSASSARHGKFQRGLFLYPSINFSSPQHFHDLEITGNVMAKGRVNDMNLLNLLDLQAYSSDWYKISGPQSFAKGFLSKSLTLDKLNGVDFKKYFLENAGQQILFPLHARDLKVRGNIFIDGLVNKNDLSSTVRFIMARKMSHQATIKGPVLFRRPVKVHHNLNVTGSINNVNFNWLTRDLVAPGSYQSISGVKTIQGAYIRKSLIVGKLNGLPLSPQLNDMVLLKKNATLVLPQSIDFRNSLSIRNNLIQTNGRMDFARLVNGISLNDLIKKAIWSQSQPNLFTTIHFSDPVEIRSSRPIVIGGKVNGLDLSRDILWLRSIFRPNQVITSRKRFSNVHFNGDVTVRGRFNGREWTSRLRDVIDNSQQNILGHTRLGGKVKLWQGASIFNIGGKFTDNLVPIESSILIPITGNWRFMAPLYIDQDMLVHGKIKNVELNELARNSLRKSVPQTLVNPIRFERVYLSNSSVIKPLIDEVRDLRRSYVDHWNGSLVRQINGLNSQIGRNLISNNALIRLAESVPLSLQGFRVFQKLSGVIGNFVNLHSADSFSIGTVNRDKSLASVAHFVFDGRKDTFVSKTSTQTPFVDSQRFTLGGKSYVLFQAACNSFNQSIISNGGQIIGTLGLYYDDIKILSLNSNAKIISVLSSVRGVVETFTIGIVNQRLFFRKISTLTVTPSARKISLFQINGEIYLAVARSVTSVCDFEETGSLLFHWLAKKSFNLIQRFTNFEASNVDSYTFNNHHYLVFSDDRDHDERMGSKGVHIFKSYFPHWPKCQFKHFQSLNFDQTRDLQAFQVPSFNSPIQLLAALNHTSLQIWQQAGNAGFEEIWQTQLSEGQAFKFIILRKKLLLVVTQLRRKVGSFILEAMI